MASEITEEEDEDSYFFINKEAQKDKIRQLLKHQKNQYNSSSSSCSSYSLSSSGVALRSSCSSSDNNQSQKLLNLMKKGSRSLRRLFDMEHTSLGNHFEFYSCSPETKTIPLWGSDSDDAVHDDPWMGIVKFDRGGIVHEHEEHEEYEEKKKQESQEERKDSLFQTHKLTRKKSFSKLPSFYKFRFRFRFRFRLRLRLMSRIRLWFRARGEKKKKNVKIER